MTGTLTGNDAVQAIGLYAALGGVGASFDGRRVAEAVRSPKGRSRLARAIGACRAKQVRSVGHFCRRLTSKRPRCRAFRRPSRPKACSRSGGDGRPGHPADPAEAGRTAPTHAWRASCLPR